MVALIQARMGSTRLPGKVLKPIAGQPLLWHIVHRLKACRLLEEIAVATSTNPADDAIVEWCNAQGVMVVRGSEGDVLARSCPLLPKSWMPTSSCGCRRTHPSSMPAWWIIWSPP